MADEQTQRPYRASQPPVRSTPSSAPRHASGSDPLAELARLIGQNDPFGEYGRQNAARPAPQPVQPSVSAPAYADEHHVPPNVDAQRYAASQSYAQQDYAQQHYPHGDYPRGSAPIYGTQAAAYSHPEDPVQGYSAAEDHGFYDDVLPRRRIGVLAAAGIFALAIVGTAGAFGYRALFGTSGAKVPPPVIKADATPTKIVPAAASKDPTSGKLIYDRVGGAQGEKLVSREEQPVEMRDNATGAMPGQAGATMASVQPAMGTGVIATEPKKIHTIAIRPDGTELANAGAAAAAAAAAPPPAPAPAPAAPAAPPSPTRAAPVPRAQATEPAQQTVARAEPPPHRETAPSNAPLSLTPNAAAPAAPARRPVQTAVAAPPRSEPSARPHTNAASGGYAVQITSQRDEAEAQASFRGLQAKYPQQLGGKQPLIRRVDLGSKGVYYRAMVGPFSTSEEASHLCSSLKAAGGQCIVQRI
jgi:hypothetical protein